MKLLVSCTVGYSLYNLDAGMPYVNQDAVIRKKLKKLFKI